MAKKVISILAEGFEEIEALAPVDILRRAGVEVIVAGLGAQTVVSARRISVIADKVLEENDCDFDAVILHGGAGAARLAESDLVRKIIISMNSQKKIIAAICAAPALVLAPMGILNDRSATCYPGLKDKFGPSINYSESDVVVDGNIITSRGVGTALLFSLSLVEVLVGFDTREKIREAIVLRK